MLFAVATLLASGYTFTAPIRSAPNAGPVAARSTAPNMVLGLEKVKSRFTSKTNGVVVPTKMPLGVPAGSGDLS